MLHPHLLHAYLACTSTLSLLLNPAPAAPQTRTYDVVLHNQAIGQLQVHKRLTGKDLQYQVDSNVAVQFFGSKRVVTRFTSTYQNNLLTAASFRNQLNGHTKDNSLVSWDGRAYHVRVNEVASTVADRRITYSSVSLYDQEPVGIQELFSERHGQFCRLRPVAPHAYELTLPDGKKNYYRYANGQCQEVEVQQALFTLYFRLRHE